MAEVLNRAFRGRALLGDPERLERSLADFIRTTDLYKERFKVWEQERAAEPEAEEAQPFPGLRIGQVAITRAGWRIRWMLTQACAQSSGKPGSM